MMKDFPPRRFTAPMRRLPAIVLYAGLCLSFCIGLCGPSIAQAAKVKPVLLKMPIGFSTKLPALGSPIVKVKEDLEAASGGTIKVKIYEPNKLVAPFEILGAVSSGKVNAGYAAAVYWSGEMPAAPFFTAIPFGPEAGEYVAWMYYGNGLKLYRRMYDEAGKQVHALPCALVAAETSGWFAKEIKGPEDLRGLNIRFAGLGGRVLQRLGAAVTMLPASEIFPALEKGAIDATEFSSPAIDERLGFYKVAKYNYFPGWHQQATILEVLINKGQWDRLADSQRRLLEVTCKASMMDSLAYGEAIQSAVMARNRNEHGVNIRYWPDGMLALFEQTWREVAAEEAEKNAFFKLVWEDLSAFRAQYDPWESHAFLPRGRARAE